MLNSGSLIIYTDGASRGNPGAAACAVVIKDKLGNIITTLYQRIGVATSNQAEYRAIIAALEKAVNLGAGQVKLFSDSELAVRQINGRYRVKNLALRPLYLRVKELAAQLESFSIQHIPRWQNGEADKLTRQAFDNLF